MKNMDYGVLLKQRQLQAWAVQLKWAFSRNRRSHTDKVRCSTRRIRRCWRDEERREAFGIWRSTEKVFDTRHAV